MLDPFALLGITRPPGKPRRGRPGRILPKPRKSRGPDLMADPLEGRRYDPERELCLYPDGRTAPPPAGSLAAQRLREGKRRP